MRSPNNDEIKRLAEAQRKVQRAQLEVAQAQTRQQQAALDYDEVLIEVQSACHVPPGSGIDLARKVWLANPETGKLQALEMDAEDNGVRDVRLRLALDDEIEEATS